LTLTAQTSAQAQPPLQWRHEYKHQLNYADYIILQGRLRAALSRDSHVGADGKYRVRSLYFDTPDNRALFEKLDGVDRREKFRIRRYLSTDLTTDASAAIHGGGAAFPLSAAPTAFTSKPGQGAFAPALGQSEIATRIARGAEHSFAPGDAPGSHQNAAPGIASAPASIRLEKKSKIRGLCNKQSALLTEAECQRLLAGDICWMADANRPLLAELYSKMRGQGLRPKTIIEYTREPFVYAAGNVRVTFDSGIRTGIRSTDFLDDAVPLAPADEVPVLLEVKYDAFLPSFVESLLQVGSRRAAACSKYALGRVYG